MRLIPPVRPYSNRFIKGFICMLIYVACWPLLAYFAGNLIPAIGSGDLSKVASIIVKSLFVFLVQKIWLSRCICRLELYFFNRILYSSCWLSCIFCEFDLCFCKKESCSAESLGRRSNNFRVDRSISTKFPHFWGITKVCRWSRDWEIS